jgi:hypothetical protein
MGATFKWFFLSRNLGVPKFPQLELPRFWRRITWRANLQLQWGVKQSFSPCQELSNGMSQATYTWRNWVDSWLLVVKSQTANLTLDFSFDHNLCFRCPNGQCEPILDIYVSIAFQWYKELFDLMSFDSYSRLLKIWESIWKSIWESNSQNGSSLGSVRVHALTLFCTLMSTRCDSRSSFLACNLVNPCFSREPKARVAKMRKTHWLLPPLAMRFILVASSKKTSKF